MNWFKNHKIFTAIGIVVLLAIIGGVVVMLQSNKNEPGSTGWKKQQYGAICERGVKEGLDINTTEYSICTRDLGYNIKGIEPEKATSSETSETTQTTETSPTPNDSQVKEAQRVGCVSLRAVKLDDLIASNKQNGISEEDTRITYQSGIAQCDAQGF